MENCLFCEGKPIRTEYCTNGTKPVMMMLDIMLGRIDDRERDYAYDGIMLKEGNKLCFDNSSGEYSEQAIDINYCPFCGKELKADE